MRTIFTAVALGLLIGAGPAGAVNFYFDSYGGFVEGSNSVSPFPNGSFSGDRDPRDANNQPTGDGNDAWTDFGWGTPLPATGPQSNAVLSGYEDDIAALGSSVRFGQIEHFNEVINEWWEPGDFSGVGNEGPATITISWNLDLYGSLADAQNGTNPIVEKEYEFLLSFFETRNVANINDCTTPLAGFDRTHLTNCDDLFFVSQVGQDGGGLMAVGPDGVFTLEDTFSFDGQEFTLTVDGFYEPIDPRFPQTSEYELRGPHWSCEGGFPGTSGVPCTARWNFQVVPEPATGLLASMGLVAMALLRRRGGRY